MKLSNYLALVAHTAFHDFDNPDGTLTQIYQSNFDNSYLTMVGQEGTITYLAAREITEQLTHGVGFSPKDGKWYGWSHRAIFGFEIGSTCKKGDCHYNAEDKEAFMAGCLAFWGEDDFHESSSANFGVHAEEFYECSAVEPAIPGAEVPDEDDDAEEKIVYGETKHGVWVHWRYNNKVPNEKMRGELGSNFTPFPDNFGRGEWTAETLEDAKQMAIDFNEGVS